MFVKTQKSFRSNINRVKQGSLSFLSSSERDDGQGKKLGLVLGKVPSDRFSLESLSLADGSY